MKIAIPVKEKSLSSEVDDRFARAAFILIYDMENKTTKFLEDIAAQAHGAGPMMVEALTKNGVDILIAKSLGQNAFTAINQTGIKVYLAKEGTAEENIKNVIDGTATEMEKPGPSFH
ncbi:MAG: NifB/NifX family molybdenum-iron cluster-binding protein [Kosmotoga sp.]|uniref:NifB/NifX family molybdenum-iron cluster-binding protein n=1 Tax=Kosmotoga sp. TaxID=1955248 RepID=UPI0025B823C9|nr:NifB/NifX family molybdenum-iron cluster-binding protein [Kosmotoga sp.]MCD6159135.1 NifB/NifX family molybdenum-iron cluster-binding protein [Kosmotoga sp.]